MSDFSEKCKCYLIESGSNVYQLSQTFGLDRTTLQRMTTGNRLPSIDFVLKFCKGIRLNALQKAELTELYQMEKLGKAVYNNRKCIQNILKFLAHLEAPSYVTRSVFGTSAWVEIARYLELCFQSPQDLTICSNLPPDCISFFNSLQKLRLKYKRSLPVKHIFTMQSNPSVTENVNSNLELLYTILPMVLSDYEHYNFYYYYSKASTTDWDLSLFPYYIIADGFVILISSGLTDVLYLTEPVQRILMLKCLMQGTPTSYQPVLLKKGFPCCTNVHLDVYDDLSVRILYLDPTGQFYNLLLTENSIGYALQDFCDALSESDQVYTSEELHNILNSHIQQLEQQL